jgi:hypothetical protein
MLRRLAQLICLMLAIGLVVPVTPVAAIPMRQSAPMTSDCMTPDTCCDTRAPCAVTCADRCLVMMPTQMVVLPGVAGSVMPIDRSGSGLRSHHATPEPPVPRLREIARF